MFKLTMYELMYRLFVSHFPKVETLINCVLYDFSNKSASFLKICFIPSCGFLRSYLRWVIKHSLVNVLALLISLSLSAPLRAFIYQKLAIFNYVTLCFVTQRIVSMRPLLVNFHLLDECMG